MAQNWTDDVFDPGHVGQTDLQNIENNFACLKSSFSGSSAPVNPVPGMFWVDTTNHILKMRNEANNAWLNVWDLANDKPYGQDFTDGSYLDGDKVDIDFTPGNYTPSASPAEADDEDDLTAHLYGIDQAIADARKLLQGAPHYVSRGTAEAELTMEGDSWVTVSEHRIYVPPNTPSSHGIAYIKTSSSDTTAYFRFCIDGSCSGDAAKGFPGYGWVGPLWLGGLSEGWHTLSIQLRNSSPTSQSYIRAYTVIGAPT